MSRKLTMLGLLLATPALADEPTVLDRYRAFVSAGVSRCDNPRDTSEILVCARREGDRYRVPFVGYEAGDPRGESVKDERERVMANPPLPCGIGAILAHCGFVGVTVGLDFGVSGTSIKRWPLAE